MTAPPQLGSITAVISRGEEEAACPAVPPKAHLDIRGECFLNSRNADED